MNNKQNYNTASSYSDFEKLTLVHEYIKYLITEEILPADKNELKITFSTFKYNKTDADIIYRYINDLYGYSDFPKIVSDKSFKKIPRAAIYRSADSFDHLANTLVDHNFHYGWGFAANGLYFDSNPIRAAKYHIPLEQINNEKFKQKVQAQVLTAKLNSNKIINSEYLKSELLKSINGKLTTNELLRDKMEILTCFLSSISYDKVFDEELFIHMLLNDPAKLGIMLNIDALNVKNNFHPLSIVVINRTKLVVSKSEVNRICCSSDYYKDFVLYDENQPTQNG